MIRIRKGLSSLAILLLVVASLVATVQLTSDAQAVGLDESMLWASADVRAEICPGLNDNALRQISDSGLARIRKHLGEGTGYSYDRAYRVYSLSNVDVINAFNEKGSLCQCISPEFKWNVPLIAGKQTTGTATLTLRDKTWCVSSFGDAPSGEVSLLGDLNKMEALLTDKGLSNITQIKAVYLPLYHITMLYICSDGEEYAMAVNEARFTDIETYEIYTAKQFIDALEKAFGKPVPQDPKEPVIYGLPGSK